MKKQNQKINYLMFKKLKLKKNILLILKNYVIWWMKILDFIDKSKKINYIRMNFVLFIRKWILYLQFSGTKIILIFIFKK